MLRALVAVIAVCGLAGEARAAGVLELLGQGVQIYRCTEGSSGFGWSFTAPEAALLTADGKAAGHHFAGPSWQAPDGSLVVGEAVASGNVAGAIPWLVLRAKSHSGSGAFAAVTYVTRSRTMGGLAPAEGCDAAHAGAEVRVAYGATYTFFGVE